MVRRVEEWMECSLCGRVEPDGSDNEFFGVSVHGFGGVVG